MLAIGLVVVVGVAAAAITLTYTTTTTVTTSVTPPPVQFVAGSDSGPSALTNYVTAYAISTNKTSMTATVKGVPESTLVIGSYLQLQNVDAGAAHSVTLTTPQVSNAYVTAYTLGIYTSGNVLQDTLDLRAASPTVTFSLPASTTYYGKLTLTLATGAGADNVALTNAVTLTTV
ncbi:MAG: hypothetical protein WDA16_13020 [Candidatus Thermoplasmatota archaeon]